MASIIIRKNDGSEAGNIDLNDVVFQAEPNAQCVRATVVLYQTNQRLGTHSTQNRSMVRGGGRKPFRQKGTGRARQGSIRSVQWRGGAVAFGPHPRDYKMRVNRKVRTQAFRSVWSDLVQRGRLIVVEGFGLEKPGTGRLAEMLGALGVDLKKQKKNHKVALLVTEKTDPTMALSARNLPQVTALNASNLNIYDLLVNEWVIVTPEVIRHVEATYA